MRLARLGFILLMIATFGVARGVTAQDATPSTVFSEATCTVDPIDPDTYNAAIAAATPPVEQPIEAIGDPVSDEVATAVIDTIVQSVSCTNAGDLGRLLAVIDPAYAPTLLGVPTEDIPAAVEAAAASSVSTDPATPLVDDVDGEGLVSQILRITDIVDLGDGKVAAVTTIQREGFPPTTFTIYFQWSDEADRYIITWYTFHPEDATPAA